MWIAKGFQYLKPETYLRRKTSFIDRDFQVRYTLLLICASTLGMVLLTVPIYYFINENYQIFFDLAYQESPEMLGYLEMERDWINTIIFGVFVGLLVFFSLLGYRMTARIVAPLKVLKNHMKQISRGHWYLPTIRVRTNDEFQDLIESYNYFYSSFQNNLKKDLENLKKITVDPHHRDAYRAWHQMVQEKTKQLNLSEEVTSPLHIVSEDASSPQNSQDAS